MDGRGRAGLGVSLSPGGQEEESQDTWEDKKEGRDHSSDMPGLQCGVLMKGLEKGVEKRPGDILKSMHQMTQAKNTP